MTKRNVLEVIDPNQGGRSSTNNAVDLPSTLQVWQKLVLVASDTATPKISNLRRHAGNEQLSSIKFKSKRLKNTNGNGIDSPMGHPSRKFVTRRKRRKSRGASSYKTLEARNGSKQKSSLSGGHEIKAADPKPVTAHAMSDTAEAAKDGQGGKQKNKNEDKILESAGFQECDMDIASDSDSSLMEPTSPPEKEPQDILQANKSAGFNDGTVATKNADFIAKAAPTQKPFSQNENLDKKVDETALEGKTFGGDMLVQYGSLDASEVTMFVDPQPKMFRASTQAQQTKNSQQKPSSRNTDYQQDDSLLNGIEFTEKGTVRMLSNNDDTRILQSDDSVDVWSLEDDEASVPIEISLKGKRFLHPPLPPGWNITISKSHHRPYYTHPDFGSSWHCPVVLPPRTTARQSLQISKSGADDRAASTDLTSLGNRTESERPPIKKVAAENDAVSTPHFLKAPGETASVSSERALERTMSDMINRYEQGKSEAEKHQPNEPTMTKPRMTTGPIFASLPKLSSVSATLGHKQMSQGNGTPEKMWNADKSMSEVLDRYEKEKMLGKDPLSVLCEKNPSTSELFFMPCNEDTADQKCQAKDGPTPNHEIFLPSLRPPSMLNNESSSALKLPTPSSNFESIGHSLNRPRRMGAIQENLAVTGAGDLQKFVHDANTLATKSGPFEDDQTSYFVRGPNSGPWTPLVGITKHSVTRMHKNNGHPKSQDIFREKIPNTTAEKNGQEPSPSNPNVFGTSSMSSWAKDASAPNMDSVKAAFETPDAVEKHDETVETVYQRVWEGRNNPKVVPSRQSNSKLATSSRRTSITRLLTCDSASTFPEKTTPTRTVKENSAMLTQFSRPSQVKAADDADKRPGLERCNSPHMKLGTKRGYSETHADEGSDMVCSPEDNFLLNDGSISEEGTPSEGLDDTNSDSQSVVAMAERKNQSPADEKMDPIIGLCIQLDGIEFDRSNIRGKAGRSSPLFQGTGAATCDSDTRKKQKTASPTSPSLAGNNRNDRFEVTAGNNEVDRTPPTKPNSIEAPAKEIHRSRDDLTLGTHAHAQAASSRGSASSTRGKGNDDSTEAGDENVQLDASSTEDNGNVDDDTRGSASETEGGGFDMHDDATSNVEVYETHEMKKRKPFSYRVLNPPHPLCSLQRLDEIAKSARETQRGQRHKLRASGRAALPGRRWQRSVSK